MVPRLMVSEIFRPILIEEYMGNDNTVQGMRRFTSYITQRDQTRRDITQVRTETTR